VITAIHVTHEARTKMGGIGTVLEGLITSTPYQMAIDRTLLVGTADLPLRDPPFDLSTVLYETDSPAVGPNAPQAPAAAIFHDLEATYGVHVFYGQRALRVPSSSRRVLVDLLLLDVRQATTAPVNAIKAQLFQRFGLQSDRFENEWGYEEWMRLAMPALAAVTAYLGHVMDGAVLMSHEFMGLPTLLAARIHAPDLKTVYWAHEVPPVRDLIENSAEHRLRFDRAIETAEGRRTYEAILGEETTFKHALVRRGCAAHAVFAVSDRVAEELRLLDRGFHETPIEIVYNGLPAQQADLEGCLESRRRVLDYVETLMGVRPDFLLTHVARPVVSKAIGRDLAVLAELDPLLRAQGRTAVLIFLATDGGRRSTGDLERMEREYGWPRFHRIGWPDLVKGEVEVGLAVQRHNETARATRAVLINQFGFRLRRGDGRAAGAIEFADLRQGSDAEFGQSTYEPFGISPLEVLAFGGISVLSRSCGCMRLLERLTGGRLPANVLVADYATAPDRMPANADDAERAVARTLAKELIERLPSDREALGRLLEAGAQLAHQMSWTAVCQAHFLPALERCLDLHRSRPVPPMSMVH